ncbi:rRNA pseudouridine synthase [bacterium]|nr:rRNA pseudouridine synthase [bacterium]
MKLIRFLAVQLNLSRRNLQKIIKEGRVTVNGELCEFYSKILVNGDSIIVDNQKFIFETIKNIYYLYYKPEGLVVSHNDKFNETVYENLEFLKDRKILFAGRLDKGSRGLMIITSDGEYVQKMTSPSNHVEKEYEVTVAGKKLELTDIDKMRNGILDEGQNLKIKEGIFLGFHKGLCRYKIILTQGKKREIRRLFSYFNCDVIDLFRVRIDEFLISDMKSGELREFFIT